MYSTLALALTLVTSLGSVARGAVQHPTGSRATPDARATIIRHLKKDSPLVNGKNYSVKTTKTFPGGTRHVIVTGRGGDEYPMSISAKGKVTQLTMKQPTQTRTRIVLDSSSKTHNPALEDFFKRFDRNQYTDEQKTQFRSDFAYNTMIETARRYRMGEF